MTFALRMDQWSFLCFHCFFVCLENRRDVGSNCFIQFYFSLKSGTVWFDSLLVFLWSPA
ncbi:hypothetical protein GHT06_013126 [Daphnia sinensis]|uniref:Uncharacterized protein n=1 Tax=Daphnia sinensis TaxID=1820382 RepID=A0AAD5KX14_9CRUS|nr:hypothetical protein GHT06_013126 [Daphnia sinensis]